MKHKAHPTMYQGVRFRSRLEARWAAFFDLVDWQWEYEPVDMDGWTPDFWVRFPCGHSECNGGHELHVEVKPYRDIEEFRGHAAYEGATGTGYASPHPAVFGLSPLVSRWVMVHGDGGGEYDIAGLGRLPLLELWRAAGNAVQWRPRA